MPKKAIEDSSIQKAFDLKNAGNYAAAVQMLEEVIEKNPDSAVEQSLLGSFYFCFLQAPRKALPHLKMGVRLAPRSEMASLGLFNWLWDMNRREEALEEIKRFQLLTDWSCRDYREIVAEIIEKWTGDAPQKQPARDKAVKKPLAKSQQ